VRSTLKPDVAQADKLARQFVLERDGYLCQNCGKWAAPLEWAHLVTRAAKHLRWDPDNAVTLCGATPVYTGCHGYFTAHPVQFRRFVAEHFGPDHYDNLKLRQAQAERRGDKVDVAQVIAFYRERLTPAESDRWRNGEW